MKITTQQRIETKNDSCIITVQADGRIHIGSIALDRSELSDFRDALRVSIDKLVAENPEQPKP